MTSRRTLSGPAGSAVECVPPISPLFPASLAAWFLQIPGASPAWDTFLVCLITLSDLPGYPPANRKYPEAQYELLVTALHPEPNPTADDMTTWHHLTPLNYVTQFHGCTDSQALQLTEHVVRMFIDGHLPIEPAGVIVQIKEEGGRQTHMELPNQVENMPARDYFKRLILRTVEHLAAGGHGGEG